MIEYKAKNWAGFYEDLKKEHETLSNEIKETSDPYKQWEYKEKLEIINEVMKRYVEYLKTIGNDNGIEFLKYLEKEAQDTQKLQRNEVFNAKVNLIVGIFRDFKKFRLEE